MNSYTRFVFLLTSPSPQIIYELLSECLKNIFLRFRIVPSVLRLYSVHNVRGKLTFVNKFDFQLQSTSMEDSKDDKKEAKTVNFHQMELDDRILKVNSGNSQKNINAELKIFLGDRKARLDQSDDDSRESNSADSRR